MLAAKAPAVWSLDAAPVRAFGEGRSDVLAQGLRREQAKRRVCPPVPETALGQPDGLRWCLLGLLPEGLEPEQNLAPLSADLGRVDRNT